MKPKIILTIVAFLLFSVVFAATPDPAAAETAAQAPVKGFTFSDLLIWALGVLIIMVTVLVIYQLSAINLQVQRLRKIVVTGDKNAVLDKETVTERFLKRFSGLKPMSMEGELIMEDHEYDGIQELKNGMPPWLQAFFGVTIAFALFYWTYYQILKIGPDQNQEYQTEMDIAKQKREERKKLLASTIDENNVTPLTDPADLAEGKNIFITNCGTCHKNDGGGDAGPNLTDEFWIHGGGINNIYKTIKTGYLEKGMPGWEDKLSPLQIQSVSSFVLSLQGTTPATAKAPQGEKWTGEVTSDSTATVAPADSAVTDSLTK